MDIITTLLGIIVGLLILVFLVVIHELGHAIVARRNGVVVEEFGIGFPPRAYSRRLKNGILFSLNWLPLGGFVKMQGEHDAANKLGDYGHASLWQKTKILLAGVAINWLAAVIIFTILFLVGIPKILPDQFSIASDTSSSKQPVQIAAIQAKSPADSAKLKVGDTVTRIDDTVVNSADDLINYTKSHQGKTINISILRDGMTKSITTKLRSGSDASKGSLGASVGQRETLRATWSAPLDALVLSGQLTIATLAGLGSLFGDIGQGHFVAAGDSVAGPVGILGTIFPDALRGGAVSLLFVSGLISLTLAVMNILPIPALDGGRWFVTLIFRIIRKPLDKELEERIHGTGFMILLALVALITVLDIAKLFK